MNSLKPRLIYYVHAHGSGHLATFKLLYPELRRTFEIIALTTHPTATKALQMFTGLTVIELPPKWPAGATPPAHTFTKAFEETPYTLQPAERANRLLDVITQYRPVAFYCDGSPELAIVARGMGVPVILIHLPGKVTEDPTQVFAYELADHIIAHFPAALQASPYAYHDKTFYSGFMSQYGGSAEPVSTHDSSTVTILMGNDNYDVATLQAMTNDTSRDFVIIGNRTQYKTQARCRQLGRVNNISAAVTGDIVISAAGQNSVAELLSLHKTLILLPEPRPYDEQVCNTNALADYGAALRAEPDFSAQDWKDIIEQASTFDPHVTGLVSKDAPQQVAQQLEQWYA